MEVVESFYNAIDAKKWLEKGSADIFLLDIQMPELTGLDFLRSLKVKPVTILTTAYRDYAIEGFELGVIDYLLKPIQFSRLEMAMNRAMDFLRLSKTGDTIDFTKKKEKQFELLIKTGTTKILLDYRSVVYAQGLKDYTILHTKEKKIRGQGFGESVPGFSP